MGVVGVGGGIFRVMKIMMLILVSHDEGLVRG